MSEIKTKAGHVLSTSDDPEARSVAAHVLGLEQPKPTRTKAELQRLLTKIDGTEGQSERANDIRRLLEAM